ncbi:U4/U6 small nuclear ribonucleoprotein Prp31-like [Amphibalanus amphitrite]|uniref:U4/U6 small nuclear ribonucleoprotein Prp31-like n=1 Tax=Amphibalanus amphitrite TaxID=1232801 RepID=UPI001C911786|nr:U4/U6 small nuclear ribonucleoprotein Prp31-like [Amphibalanus amphitrite]XP_043190391.1 U4/U6 small nuclear ribonucleoprotein Prp31-like [Amphibalanus amphitrite]XP_043190392.1 U4/U6 small nuclear ribonucleoprotein Prp31-like [Amphibalanus amphitrite]XP_043190393.1 U4/U6 small nuclear ribonucleoprotein Prp31-like [Amphibalanus amphitrite]XP_043247551.1 U4/U6 small nuclear ribonucleoprotein Prp31-like [Amphibalanus amphitrite]XP_043247552.1 U4/U6 small nuclear ribonucleoprotein Prp31-like [
MSLADELLADLEEDHGDDELQDNKDALATIKEEEKMETEDAAATNGPASGSVHSLLKLANSQRLAEMMESVERFFATERKAEEMVGPVEADPEYRLIVQVNQMAAEFDTEIGIIHKYCKDLYGRRFPELDSLVVGPLDYMMTARELANDLERVKNNDQLQQILTQATIMVVSVTASTTQGEPLPEADLARLMEACDLALELNRQKLRIYEYIESRMTFIAPNLSSVVGAATAAKLMGAAGGLTALSKMPACNIMLVGAEKRTLSGFSQANVLPHTGFIYYSPIVQDLPPDLRRKTARVVSAKVALAARVDSFHECPSGHVGRGLRDEIERKLDKMQEPPPVKAVKPLPAPIDMPGKRRGGKRVRKMKERYAVTEMRKQANRMTFGEIEDDAYQQDLGYTRGNIGKGGTGRIRAAQIDEKTKVRISKTLQKSLQRQQNYGGTTTVKKQVAGTASSVAFTPLQGLEIVNPQAAEKKVSEDNARYFSSVAAFAKVERS